MGIVSDMESSAQIIVPIAAAITAGTVVPGPSFVVVSQAALERRQSGLLCALGVACASLAYAVMALIGVIAMIEAVPILYSSLKIAGGLYLCALGIRLWKDAAKIRDRSIEGTGAPPKHWSFLKGFVTQGTNPKAALVYASTFAAFLPSETDTGLTCWIALVVFAISLFWYGGVGLLFSIKTFQQNFTPRSALIVRSSGAIIASFGLSILSREAVLKIA